MTKKTRIASFVIAGSVATLTAGASADKLLIVDLTVENEISISATDGLSAVDASGSDTTGIYLEGFYAGPGGSLTTTSTGAGDLTNAENPSDSSPALFRGGGGTDEGLNVWSFSSDITVTFTAGSLAFVGSGTWALDPAEYADMIALGNRSGDIYFPADTNDDLDTASLLGTYNVLVPAPAAAPIFAAGLGLIGLRRRRA